MGTVMRRFGPAAASHHARDHTSAVPAIQPGIARKPRGLRDGGDGLIFSFLAKPSRWARRGGC